MARSVLRSVVRKLMGQKGREAFYRHRAVNRYVGDYLTNKGWIESSMSRQSIGMDGPIPWITYPALMMLERIVSLEHKVFEYGCGNSSLWWSTHVAEVVSVEHDETWAKKVSSTAPSNLRVHLIPRGIAPAPEYSESADEFFRRHPELPTSGNINHDIQHGLACEGFTAYAGELAKYGKGYFDIIVVDGMARSLSTWIAVEHIKERGIIVFDNSDRWQYNPAFDILAEHGFVRLDFYGAGPASTHEWCTSIFCKNLEWGARNVRVPKSQRSDLGW